MKINKQAKKELANLPVVLLNEKEMSTIQGGNGKRWESNKELIWGVSYKKGMASVYRGTKRGVGRRI